MWKRKSDSEIKNLLTQKEIQKKSLRRPVIFGIVFGTVFMLLQYIGLRGGGRGFYIFSSNIGFSLKTIIFGLFGFIFFFVLAYYHQIKGWSFLSSDNCLLCPKCNQPSLENSESRCKCGGQLEPFEHFRWEE